MLSIGIIGYGYWGPNLVRNFSGIVTIEVKYVAEANSARHSQIRRNHPNVQILLSAEEMLQDESLDAVVIATPVSTHYTLAKQALLSGKHVLLEKPMATSVAECEELIQIAEAKSLTLMVDHTFLYTGAVQKIKEIVDSGDIGELQYFDSTRINLGIFQNDVNVLWDLAPHDISILSYLKEEKPVSVNATGISHLKNGIENIAYMTINYASNFIAHFNCSWSSPVKIRQTLISGDQKMILYNDIEPTEKVRVFDTGVGVKSDADRDKLLIDYRYGDILIPKLSTHEALQQVAMDFVESIVSRKTPLSSASIGLHVVRVLEAAEKSIKQKGKEIYI
jgi:predicted dehydrogenase